MRLCHYSDVLRGSAALAGLMLEDLHDTELALFRTFHDRRLQIAWEIHRWPDLCRTERRSFRAPYDAATAYAAGDEVLDLVTLHYFQALVPSTGRPPTISGAENSAFWALCRTMYPAPDYVSTTTYSPSAQVRNPADGETYQACYQVVDLVATNGPADGNYPVQMHTVVGAGAQTIWYYNGKPWYGQDVPITDPFYYIRWEDDGTGTFRWNLARVDTDTSVHVLAYSYSDTPTPDGAVGWLIPTGKFTTEPSGLTLAGSRPLPGAGWAKLTPFHRTISLDQPGETPIGEVLQATDRDPRLKIQVSRLDYLVTEAGVEFAKAGAYVWLLFRLRRPELTGSPYDATAVYASGQQVYFVSLATGQGNFYDCSAPTSAGESPSTAPAKWSMVALPYCFRQYLIAGGHVDWLTSDGQTDEATALENSAAGLLELEADKLQRQQGQVNRFQFRS